MSMEVLIAKLAQGLKAEAEAKKQTDEQQFNEMVDKSHLEKGVTHHFAVTNTTAVDVSTKETLDSDKDSKMDTKKHNRKKWFCGCLGKPGE